MTFINKYCIKANHYQYQTQKKGFVGGFNKYIQSPFLPESWKCKTTPNERKLLLEGPIFHFHDCGTKGAMLSSNGSPTKNDRRLKFGFLRILKLATGWQLLKLFQTTKCHDSQVWGFSIPECVEECHMIKDNGNSQHLQRGAKWFLKGVNSPSVRV